MIRKLSLTTLFAGVLLVGVGCSDNLVGPENELEAANVTDDFQWQVTNLNDVTQTFSYTWRNTGTTANVDHSSSVSKGDAVLTIRDADGAQVYSGDLTDGGSFSSSSGSSGDWSIRVRLSGVTGTVNFRVQKP